MSQGNGWGVGRVRWKERGREIHLVDNWWERAGHLEGCGGFRKGCRGLQIPSRGWEKLQAGDLFGCYECVSGKSLLTLRSTPHPLAVSRHPASTPPPTACTQPYRVIWIHGLALHSSFKSWSCLPLFAQLPCTPLLEHLVH